MIVCPNLWHVHVVDEDDEPFAGRRSVRIFGSLLDVCLQIPLYVERRGTTGEVHIQQQLWGKASQHITSSSIYQQIGLIISIFFNIQTKCCRVRENC